MQFIYFSRKIVIILFCLLVFAGAWAQNQQILHAGMNSVKLDFMLDAEGQPLYKVYFGDKPVINNSYLGIKLANDSAFDKHFKITGSEKKEVDEYWVPVWGEVSKIRNHYQQLTVHLKQQGVPGRLM